MNRILIHSHFFYPSIGGCETFADLLATGLAAQGLDVSLVTECPLNSRKEWEKPYRILRSVKWEDERLLDHTELLISSGPSIRYLRLAAKRKIPRVLIHHGPHGVCPAAIGWREGRRCQIGIPRCLTCDVCGQNTWANVRNLLRFAILKKETSRADANVFVSHYLKSLMHVPNSHVIWNCFNDQVFRPIADVAKVRPTRLFTFVGRLVNLKGVDVALQGFAQLVKRQGKAKLRIIGGGPEEKALKLLAESLCISNLVEFQPFADPVNVARCFSESWAALVPSRWEEPFGIVVVEAMGSGCPVIASDCGAPPEIIGQTGILVSAQDAKGWANAMESLLIDEPRRHLLAQAAVERAHREFTIPIMVARYRELIEAIVSKSQH